MPKKTNISFLPDPVLPKEQTPVGRITSTPGSTFSNAFMLDTHVGQLFQRNEIDRQMGVYARDIDTNYNAMRDPRIRAYPIPQNMLDDVASADSYEMAMAALRMSEVNAERERMMAGHGIARFLTGFADPYNFIPVPLVRGKGFINAAKQALVPNAAIVTAAELGRTSLDPNDSIAQTAMNIGFGTVFASTIAGVFGVIPHSPEVVNRHVNAFASINEYRNVEGSKGPKMTELAMNKANFEQRYKPYVPEGVTYRDIIKGTADDGLGTGIIRMQALRAGDQPFGDRLVITKDELAGDFTLTRNGELVQRGSKRDLIQVAEELGVKRVDNFASRDALEHGISRREEVYPNAPDPETMPAEYQKYVDEQLPWDAPRDENGARIPDHNGYFNRHIMRDAMDAEQLNISEKLNDKDAEVARLEAEVAQAQRALRYRNQYSAPRETIEADLQQATLALGVARSNRHVLKNSLDDINERISLSEQTDNPTDYMLSPTGTKLEKLMARSGQFPFFALTETKLVDLAPDLALDWQRIAPRLAGSPGLMFRGGEKGVGFGTSAEMQSTQWWSHFRQAKSGMDREYARLYGYGESIGPLQQTVMETKESIVLAMGKKDKDISATGEGMSFPEFRVQVGKTLINGGTVGKEEALLLGKEAVSAIETSAAHWRRFFDTFKAEAEKLGVFQTQESIGRQIEWRREKLQELQNHIDIISGNKLPDPFPEAGVEVRRGKYPEGLKDPDPAGNIPAAFRRTEGGKSVIYIEPFELEAIFQRKGWNTPRPMRDGSKVTPLKDLLEDFKDFATPAEFENFVLAHERSHVINLRRKGESVAAYEDRTNRLAWAEIQKNLSQTPKATGLQKSMLSAYQKDADLLELKIDQLEQQLDSMKGMSGAGDWLSPDYFFRMWLPDKAKKGEADLKQILTAHFNAQPYTWHNGKLSKRATSPEAVAVRVNEAYDNIIREGEFDDPFLFKDPARQRKQLEGRRDELIAQLDASTASSNSIEVRTLRRRIYLYDEALKRDDTVWSTLLPRPLRSRALDIHNNKVLDYIELDVEHVAHVYLQKMAPLIEVSRNFGDRSLEAYREPLNRALAQRIGEVRARGDEKLATALEAEQTELNKAADNLRDMVLGVYGLSRNPAHWSGRAARLSMAWMNLVGMGKAVIVALNDMGNYIGYVGARHAFGNTFRYAMARLRNEANEWNFAYEEVLAAGEAAQMWSSQRAISLTDIGGAPITNKIERGVQTAQQRMFVFNLLTPWTDFMEGMNGAMAQNHIIRDAVAMADGKLSKSRMREVTKLGMTKEMAHRIADQWRKVPEADRQGRHLLLANTHQWDDDGAVRAFRAMLSTEIANLVPSPRAADRPSFMHKDWGRVMFQYKGFSFAATTKIMMANLQRRDARALSTALSMIAMSLVIDAFKRPDYIELDIWDALFRAVEISGVSGIFADVNQAVEGVTGGEYGMRPSLGLKPFERDVNMQTRFGAAAGAVPNYVTSTMEAMLSDDATMADKARAIRYMIPFNNLLYYSWLVSRLQRSAADALE